MGALQKFWSGASVGNCSRYLIFLAIPDNLIMWGYDIWALRTSLLEKLDIFLHHSIWSILGIKMNEVKEQHTTNESVRKKLFDIPYIKKQIST